MKDVSCRVCDSSSPLLSSALHKEQSGCPLKAQLSDNYQSLNKRHQLHSAKGKLEKHSTQNPHVTPLKRLFAEWRCAQTHTDIPRHSSCEGTKKTLHSWAEERAFNSCDSSDSRESGAEEHRSETALKRKQLKMSAKELCINSIFVQKYSLEDLVIKKKKTLYKIFAKLSKLFQFFFPLVSPLFSCLSDTAGLLRSSLESKIKY